MQNLKLPWSPLLGVCYMLSIFIYALIDKYSFLFSTCSPGDIRLFKIMQCHLQHHKYQA